VLAAQVVVMTVGAAIVTPLGADANVIDAAAIDVEDVSSAKNLLWSWPSCESLDLSPAKSRPTWRVGISIGLCLLPYN
jgi:hypothetical protein